MTVPSPLIKPQDPMAPILRRFLAYRLDLSQVPALNGLSQQGSDGSAIRPQGPEAYDDPASPLYWRKTGASTVADYNATLESAFKAWLTDLMTAVQNETVALTMTNGLPYLDFTGDIKSVGAYGNSLSNFDNSLSLEIWLDDYQPGGLPPKSPLLENDLVQVRVSFDGGANYYDEFVGLVTRVGSHLENDGVPSAPLEIYGLSKNLVLSTVVSQSEISGQEFAPGVQIDAAQTPSPLQTIFEQLTVKGIFLKIMYDAMGLIPASTVLGTAQTATIADPTQPKGPTAFQGFQYNILSLLTLALANAYVIDTSVDLALQALFPNRGSQGGSVFDTPYQAVLEHGEHQAYNFMVASGFSNFFASLDKPANILNEVRSKAMYDVFESLDGIIVCRPARYNRIEISLSEKDRQFLGQTPFSPTSSLKSPQILLFNKITGSWDFNPDADYCIPPNEWKVLDQSRQDDLLQSQAVAQFSIRSVGAQDFLSGTFTDPGILAKYGLRIEGPVQNPNVINPSMAQSFAPLALGIANASATSASLQAYDRPFRVGKLYALTGNEGEALVGYLIAQNPSHQEGKVGMRNLTFTLMREVLWRPINAIIQNPYELLNFALMYLPDPVPAAVPTSNLSGLPAPQTAASTLISQAKACLQQMLTYGQQQNSQVIQSVPMFRYVPTILDLMLQLDDAPSRAQPTQDTGDTPQQQEREVARRLQSSFSATPVNGLFTAMGTDKVVRELQQLQSAIASWSNDTPSSEIQLTQAYPIPAGILRYMTPFSPEMQTQSILGGSPIQEGSSFLPAAAAGSGGDAVPIARPLVNSLVAMDLAMKFNGTANASGISPNANGFPQLYGMVQGWDGKPCYRLFGSLRDPLNFINTYKSYPNGEFDFTQLANYPNLLAYDYNLSVFQNSVFSLPSNNGIFNLPDGHLAWLVDGQWSFAIITAGRFQIQKQPNSGYLIRAVSPKASVTSDTYQTTNLADFIAPNLGGTYVAPNVSPYNYAIESGENATSNSIVIAAPDGFYLLSPWTDLTLERMADAALFSSEGPGSTDYPVLLGYRTASEELTLINANPSLASQSGNDLHLSGQAFDFLPDLLAVASESDLKPLNPAYQLFASFMSAGGFSDADVQSFCQIAEAGSISYSYPDTGQGSVAVGQWFHFGITNAQIAAFLQKYIPIPGTNPVGENQTPDPGPGGTVSEGG